MPLKKQQQALIFVVPIVSVQTPPLQTLCQTEQEIPECAIAVIQQEIFEY